jgi:hypothetical protein
MRQLLSPTDYIIREKKRPGRPPFHSLQRVIHGSRAGRKKAIHEFSLSGAPKLHKTPDEKPARGSAA